MDDVVQQQLDQARSRLLDLTMRNRLLNFRPTRRTTIQIVDELPAEVWKLLVDGQKAMSFLAREEHEVFESDAGEGTPDGAASIAADRPADAGETQEDTADGELFELPGVLTGFEGDEEALPERYTDLFLQTWLPGEVLQTNLLRTYQAANSALEERGVNLLFLAVGFLEWRDKNHPERVPKAPILLVPVRLDRTSARRRFRLHVLDDDPVLNPCLAAKLEREYGVELPGATEDWGEFDVEGFLQAVAAAVSVQVDWRVLPEMVLGLFSFAKYLMYVDLDPSRWPEGRGLLANPLVRALCGDSSGEVDLSDLPAPESMDDALDPEDVYQVLDADASQQEAVVAAKRGKSLVIEGPPGTGKSQTIANLIAECLAAEKTVLFVSEKMAALEVVKRRLDAVGLGDFCLELHSTKANRKAVVGEFRRVLEKGPPRTGRKTRGAAKLLQLRTRLNAYVRALHQPFAPSGISPYEAMGRVALLHDIPDIACEMPGHEGWTGAEIDEHKELVRRLARRMEAVWPVEEHPWRGARLASCDAQTQRSVEQSLDTLLAAADGVQSCGAEVACLLGAAAPTTLRAAGQLREAAGLVASAPAVADRLLREDVWDELSPEGQVLLRRLKEAGEVREALRGRYRDDAVDAADWQGVHERFRRKYTSAIGRWIRPGYWSDRGLVKRARAEGHRPSFAQQVEDVGRLARLQSLEAELAGSEEVGVRHLDAAWAGKRTAWRDVEPLATWLTAFRKAAKRGLIGAEGIALAGEGADRTRLERATEALDAHVAAWGEHWQSLTRTTRLAEPLAFAYPVAATDLRDLRERLAEMRERAESLVDWSEYQHMLQACESGPLGDFVARAQEESVDPEVFALAMEKRLLRLLVKAATAEREALKQFKGADHEADRLTFAKLDARWIDRCGDRLRAKLAADKPSGHLEAAASSQLGILQGEVRRVRGGRTIRRLLRDAADAVQKLKPCLMMSPLSVAQFVDPHGMRFDVVVFDEASQVEPADALGAVARGAQLILVGDPKQLPPTSFFDAMSGEGGAIAADEAAGLSDMESILDRGAMVLPCMRLRWHYRSRHESLIAFSNQAFYEGSLVVFPSGHLAEDALGLSLRYEPSDRYDRGRTQANRDQARRVARWVFEHAAEHPDKSLGVGAFSQRQQQAVLDEIEKLRRQDDSLETFFDREKAEPFFVKNLETIQGDERDVILLSTGYGKAREGERLSMNFGPLNQDKGWRRLNVLITRARERCVVFSAIRPEDFDLSATQAAGVHALHGYLAYAASRGPAEADAEGDEFAADLVQTVHDALTAEGVALRRNIGFAGSSIDLAVVDAERPDRYVLGIECDGGTYAACATARDRDRLRQQVLEGLGWRVHRIWSVDWFRAPQRELARTLEAIEEARQGRSRARFAGLAQRSRTRPPGEDEEPEAKTEAEGGGDEPPAGVAAEAYRFYEVMPQGTPEEFHVAPLARLSKVVCEIVACEGPIHVDELARRIGAVWRMRRMGARAQKRFEEALHAAVAKDKVQRRQPFVWPAEMDDPPVRRRDAGGVRDIELICAEEIAKAARLLLAAQFGMPREALTTQVARLLGFSKSGSRIAERVDAVIASELEASRITADPAGVLKAETQEPAP